MNLYIAYEYECVSVVEPTLRVLVGTSRLTVYARVPVEEKEVTYLPAVYFCCTRIHEWVCEYVRVTAVQYLSHEYCTRTREKSRQVGRYLAATRA